MKTDQEMVRWALEESSEPVIKNPYLRSAFRSNLPSTEAGTIPPEFDELSDREVEYYKTGPWSTREDYRKGQLVQPGPGRLGFSGGKLVTVGPNKGKYRFWYGASSTGTYKSYYAKSPEEGRAWVKKQSTDFKWLKKGTSIEDVEKRIGELGKTGEHTQAEIHQILKDEGYVKPSKVDTINYNAAKTKVNKTLTKSKIKVPTTTDIQGNVLMKLVKKHPKVDTIQGIAELAQKELNLKQIPYQTVKRWVKANNIKLLTIDEKIFPEMKALDKLVRGKIDKFENIQRGIPPGRGAGFKTLNPIIENNANAISNSLFREIKKLGFNLTPDQLNARLVKLDALYSGRLQPGTTYAADIYKAIKPIKNYEKSKFKKGLFATVKSGGYTGLLQEAQLLGLPEKDIQLLTDVLKGSRKLSRVKIAGDHTDSNALIRAVLNEKNWKQYKKDFMRINVISNTLNKVKMPFDKRIAEAYKDWKMNKISQSEFNAIVRDTKEALLKKTKIPIGNPKIVSGEFQFNFLTERMGDLKNPRNKAVLGAMNNLVKQSGVKFKGLDQELMFANNVKERFDILKNAGIDQLKNSKYLKAFAQMSGNVGKAAHTILKSAPGKIGATTGIYALLSSIASASEKDEKGEIDVDEVTKSGMQMPTVGQTVTAGALSKLSGKLGAADPLKYFRKVPRKIFSSLGTPAGAVAAWPLAAMGMKKAGWMEEDEPAFNIKSTGDRIGAEAELVLAPTLVSWTDKLTKPIKNKAVRAGVTQLLNLGMSPAMAFRAARVASPIGLLSLAGEGIYHAGKKEMARREQMSPQELEDFHLERQSRGWSRMGQADGGITNVRRPWAIPPESGPDPQGLASLNNYATKRTE